ncbi:FimV/HubP family polar landmark protein [Chromatium okenii]|uniref:FimV N-terminal domain-containing protein n=1 Tax=Chromatium okenii TaxID=61644 RepID=A0A2S7XN20_9GAMM|nr:FimV/HubP family polar landmark protein [Chromatium okenii]PQJ95120.1 hypothetical protein CXB77_12510 [Chromatium okenii]
MSRKLILAAAATLLFAGNDVVALGLGEIRAYSGLNQPFKGEIELYDVTPEERDAIQVTLASQDAFDNAGIERYYDLTKLKFTLDFPASGAPVIQVTSREPIREPYLDMLLEVYWSKGQLVKEFTVLLEPPERLKQTAPPVRLPTTSAATNSNAALPSDASGFPLMIGPIERGTGLWQVARANAPAGATAAQTALALYRNNQDAFTRGNINRLVSGKMLMIPTQAELLALDPQTADREFTAARRGGAVSRAPLTAVPDMAQLRIIGARTPAASPAAAAPAAGTTTGNPRRLEQDVLIALETTESTRQEALELRGRIRELETQLATIQQLLEQNDLTATPNTASTQNTPGVLATTSPVAVEPTTAAVATEEPALPETPSVAEVVNPNPPAVAPVAAETPAPPITETAAPAPISNVAPLPLPPVPDVAAPISPPKNPATAPPVTATENADQPEESSLWSSLMLPLAGLAGLSALGILGFAWVISRRRTAELSEKEVSLDLLDTENEDFEGEPTAFLNSSLEPNTAVLPSTSHSVAATSAAAVMGASQHSVDDDEEPETPMSLISSLSDFDVETDTVDPLSEADVYMVYGRHDEAQALLLKEMQRFPNRLDIKFKLAEACIGTKNIQGLNSVMASIEALGGDRSQAQQWQRLQDLAAPLLHPEQSTATNEDTFPDSFLINLNDLPPLPAASAPAPAPTFAPDDETADLGFDMDALPDSEPTPLQDMPSRFAVKDTGTNDAPPVMTDIQRAVIRGNAPPPVTTPPDAALSLSFDDDELDKLLSSADPLMPDPMVQPPPVKPVPPPPAPIEPLVLPDIFDLDLNFEPAPAPPKPPPTLRKVTDNADSELVLMLDDPRLEQLDDLDSLIAAAQNETPSAPPLESLSDTSWQMNSGVWDETATKLDLARAYLDMDDPEAAREILKEVIAEGREEHQTAARSMLAQIS